jgi:hypothetical protein
VYIGVQLLFWSFLEFITLFIPSFNTGTLKFISNPI